MVALASCSPPAAQTDSVGPRQRIQCGCARSVEVVHDAEALNGVPAAVALLLALSCNSYLHPACPSLACSVVLALLGFALYSHAQIQKLRQSGERSGGPGSAGAMQGRSKLFWAALVWMSTGQPSLSRLQSQLTCTQVHSVEQVLSGRPLPPVQCPFK